MRNRTGYNDFESIVDREQDWCPCYDFRALTIPIPPLELRRWVGPTDPSDYDNPNGGPLLGLYGISNEAYAAVFDFGCGCGRQARQMLQQTPRPGRYVGIDVRRELVAWCRREPACRSSPHFEFLHHDVYAPAYGPGNSLRLSAPFPVEGEAFSLVLASSVFTHLTRSQASSLPERSGAHPQAGWGRLHAAGLFFNRASFQFLPDIYALYVSEVDFGAALIFDREWFLATVRRVGLAVRKTIPPQIPGYQWVVLLVKRAPGMTDDFPRRRRGGMGLGGDSSSRSPRRPCRPRSLRVPPAGRGPCRATFCRAPGLEGALAELHQTRAALDRTDAELRATRATWAWAIGRALTSPVRDLRRFF